MTTDDEFAILELEAQVNQAGCKVRDRLRALSLAEEAVGAIKQALAQDQLILTLARKDLARLQRR